MTKEKVMFNSDRYFQVLKSHLKKSCSVISLLILAFTNSMAQQNQIFQEVAIPYNYWGKWGFANKFTGELIISPAYDTVYKKNNQFYLKLNGKTGLVIRNSPAKDPVFIEAKYDNIAVYSQAFVVQLNGKCGLLDYETHVLIPPRFKSITGASAGYKLFAVEDNYGTIGIYNSDTRKMITEMIFQIHYVDQQNIPKNLKSDWGPFFYITDTSGSQFFLNKKLRISSFVETITSNDFELNELDEVFRIRIDNALSKVPLSACEGISAGSTLKIKPYKLEFTGMCHGKFAVVKDRNSGRFGLIIKGTHTLVVPPVYLGFNKYYEQLDMILVASTDSGYAIIKDGKLLNEKPVVQFGGYRGGFFIYRESDYYQVYRNENGVLKKMNGEFIRFEESGEYTDVEKNCLIYMLTERGGKTFFVSSSGLVFMK
ncbi:MAG: hypothetical protein GC181_05210 [Bacteroidetes bacterium]|nr:hypothetical protein [Bacteroidota bacterium]